MSAPAVNVEWKKGKAEVTFSSSFDNSDENLRFDLLKQTLDAVLDKLGTFPARKLANLHRPADVAHDPQ